MWQNMKMLSGIMLKCLQNLMCEFQDMASTCGLKETTCSKWFLSRTIATLKETKLNCIDVDLLNWSSHIHGNHKHQYVNLFLLITGGFQIPQMTYPKGRVSRKIICRNNIRSARISLMALQSWWRNPFKARPSWGRLQDSAQYSWGEIAQGQLRGANGAPSFTELSQSLLYDHKLFGK